VNTHSAAADELEASSPPRPSTLSGHELQTVRGVHGSARPAAASEGACDCGAVARGAAAHSAWRAQPGFELACSAGDRAGMPAMRRVSRLLWCRPAAARATRQGPGATLDSEDKAWSLVAPRRTADVAVLKGRGPEESPAVFYLILSARPGEGPAKNPRQFFI
jgi:hypothetical protein